MHKNKGEIGQNSMHGVQKNKQLACNDLALSRGFICNIHKGLPRVDWQTFSTTQMQSYKFSWGSGAFLTKLDFGEYLYDKKLILSGRHSLTSSSILTPRVTTPTANFDDDTIAITMVVYILAVDDNRSSGRR